MTQQQYSVGSTSILPLTQFFGTQKNCVKGKPCYRRSILVQKAENGTFSFTKSKCAIYNIHKASLIYQTFKPKINYNSKSYQNITVKI